MGINKNDLLKYYIPDSILGDEKQLVKYVEMKKKEKYLKNHPYKPWQGKDGKWNVYLPDREKKRIKKTRLTKEAIEEVIVNYQEMIEYNPTVEIIFYEWLERKFSRDEIEPSTRDRYIRDFEKYFLPIKSEKVRSLTPYDIEEFVLNMIHEYNMTAKRYGNVRTLLYAIFRAAKKRDLIEYSITEVIHDFDISRKAFAQKPQHKENEVLTDAELQALTEVFQDRPDIINLGLNLDTKTGIRIGELAAIKWCDVDLKQKTIHICRTEMRYISSNSKKRTYEVKDTTKTPAGMRDIILPESAVQILRQIRRLNPFGEYVFESDGERIRTYIFRQRLHRDCKLAGIPNKPPHSLRRTYATMLIDSGVEESFVLAQMGHTDIKTTLGYYYKERISNEQKLNVVNSVFG